MWYRIVTESEVIDLLVVGTVGTYSLPPRIVLDTEL